MVNIMKGESEMIRLFCLPSEAGKPDRLKDALSPRLRGR